MDSRLKSALSKLGHGTWSLTVAGFAGHALKMPSPLSREDRAEAHRLMMETGLPHRRITYGIPVDVWDYTVE